MLIKQHTYDEGEISAILVDDYYIWIAYTNGREKGFVEADKSSKIYSAMDFGFNSHSSMGDEFVLTCCDVA